MPLESETNAARVERLVETYSDTLLRVAAHQLQNRTDAEDAVQAVFLKALQRAPQFASAEHEKAWLIRVTINQCRDYLRSAWYKKTVPLENYNGFTDDTPTSEVLSAVRALGEKYSIVIYLYYYEGYSTAEIAEILQTRQGTVESRLFRARAKLKNALQGGWD